MAASSQNVVDELVVTLTLDSEQYKQDQKQVVEIINKTEVTLNQADEKQKKREEKQKAQRKDSLKGVKDLAAGMRGLALTVASLLGVGSAAGIVGSIVAFTGMETGLRRASVATGMSNRQLQAWGATARRLGADAAAGQSAVADLAREQQQYALTGQAPTMTALQRIGVQAGPNTSIVDMLEQAQKLYRAAPEPQKQNMEATLSASGVSADLVVAIKSEKDVREEYTRSLAESATENRKALDAVSDALAAFGNSAMNMANSLATVAQPYIEQFAKFVSASAQTVSAFTDKVIQAGGGVAGFMNVLTQDAPEFAAALRGLGTGLDTLGEVVDVVVYGFQSLGRGLAQLFNWLDKGISGLLGVKGGNLLSGIASDIGHGVKQAWTNIVSEARRDGAAPIGGVMGDTGGVRLTPDRRQRAAAPAANAGGVMGYLITQYGLTVPQAAAVAANVQGESRGNPAAFNPAGGGQGARGLFQWRGARVNAFRAMYGVAPNEATQQQQLDFIMNDPYEKRLLMKSLGAGGDAANMGASFSRVFEGHGNVREDARRARDAQKMATAYSGGDATGAGTTVNIQSMTVQANDPQQLTSQLKRQSGVQNYTAAVN